MPEINKKKEFATAEFKGVNTQALRLAIQPNQQAWLENIQPIGSSNAKVVPAIKALPVQLTGTGSPSPYYAQGFNIIISGTATDILMVADQSGDLWAINLNTNAIYVLTFGGPLASKFKNTSCAQWKNERILIVDNVNGLYDWDGTTITSAGGAPYTSAPSKGQCIATFSGRVWVSDNRTVYYSSADSYSDYGHGGSSSGGSFILEDETLHSSIQQLVSSSNFLYIFGIDSCNVISDVRANAGVGALFTNTALSTGIGTAFPMSVSTYYRSIWFASATGFYAMYGASARKESDMLDGMYGDIINIANPSRIGDIPDISSGLVSLNNILCVAFLFKYNDPNDGVRPLLALNFDGKWFFASQGANTGDSAPILIADCTVKGKNNLYAFDYNGTLYQLFVNEAETVNYKWQTALWDFEQPIMFKQVTKAGFGIYYSDTPSTVNVTIDTETGSSSTNTFNSGAGWTFYQDSPVSAPSTLITFVGTSAITWNSAGYNLLQKDVTNWGRYVGMTITGTSNGATFTVALMEYNYRSQWGN